MLANTVNVQLRTSEFKDFSHQKKLNTSTSNTKDIYEKAKEILAEMYSNGTMIRLIGAKVDNLTNESEKQLSFFSNEDSENQEKLDKVVDEIKNKYGFYSITRARNLNNSEFEKIITKE